MLGRRSYLTFFGVQDGDVFSTGLVNSKDKEAFHKDLLQLQQRLVPVFFFFFNLFNEEQADTFKRYVIADVRELVLLGSPPEHYTNESVVKKWVGFTKSSWPASVGSP